MEYCVTISPDPKKKYILRNRNKDYGAMSPRIQYKELVYNIATISGRIKDISDYYFVFEINTAGNIHAHGKVIMGTEYTAPLDIKRFQQAVAAVFGRHAKTQQMIDVCCKIRLRDDSKSTSLLYKTWDEYLEKDLKKVPAFMKPIKMSEAKEYIEWLKAMDAEDIVIKERLMANNNAGLITLALDE